MYLYVAYMCTCTHCMSLCAILMIHQSILLTSQPAMLIGIHLVFYVPSFVYK